MTAWSEFGVGLLSQVWFGQGMANLCYQIGFRIFPQACSLCFSREHLSESTSPSAGTYRGWPVALTPCRVISPAITPLLP